MKSKERKAYIAGMKKAFELAAEKFGTSFGCSAKIKEEAFKEYQKNSK